MNVEKEEDIELVISSGNSTESLQAAEESFHLVPLLVDFLVILPRFLSVALRRNDRSDVLLKNKRTRLISFVGTIHGEVRCRNTDKLCN